MKTLALTSALLSTLPLFVRGATTPAKAAAVRNAITNVEKINALEDSDFVFDFTDPALKAVKGAGGKLVSANVGNFAALVGNGLAMTVGYMEPCGINSPHTHPRATEVLLLLNGTISAGFLTENGSRFVMNDVHELSAMVFPAGSVHFQANYGCEPVRFVAALSNEDPGTLQIAQRYFALPADVVGASLGGLGVKEIEGLAALIPDNVIAGTKECYQRCGIPYPEQSTKQQQPPSKSGSYPPTTSSQPIASTDYTTWSTEYSTTTQETTSTEYSTTTQYYPEPSNGDASKVIDVIVGRAGGLTYEPEDITAKIGDIVRFHFVAKNHTVTESSFKEPCMPLADGKGFDSGFQPIPAGSTEEKTFDVVVKDDSKPIWFYCRQKAANALSHCQQGMNGAINAPKAGSNTLNAFKTKASSSD